MEAAAGSLDLIIDTTPANADVAQFMNLLKYFFPSETSSRSDFISA